MLDDTPITPLTAILLGEAERLGTWPPHLADHDPDCFEKPAPKKPQP